MNWKKGRGKLGIFDPLIGSWVVETDSDMGPVRVTRVFTKSLGGKYIELRAEWTFKKSRYQELALFGVDKDKKLKFWSFTSDGKNSKGELAEATDIHPQALGFEARMPGGLARQVYWPDSQGSSISLWKFNLNGSCCRFLPESKNQESLGVY